jgi:DNA polymerase-3 subunit epsilon
VCRLDIPFPVLEVRAEPAAGHAVNVGPLRGRRAVEELAGQLSSLFRLRQCGRKLKLREFRSVYGQMDRCLSPCLGDLDPNLYRRQLDSALSLFDEDDAAGERLLEELDRRMAEASCALRYEQATALRERRARLAAVLERLEGQLRAVHARPRVVLARHPAREAWDVLWIVGGRVADWGPLGPAAELVERSQALRPVAERHSGPPVLQPEEVDEVRIVAGALAAEEPRELSLERATSRPTVARWLKAAGAPA